MNGEIDVFTLLFLVLAVVIFLKLRSVLGRKTGDEQRRLDRYSSSENGAARNGPAGGKVVSLPRREEAAVGVKAEETSFAKQEEKIRKFASNSKVADGLVAIYRADRNFSPEEFLQGAKTAYEMTVSAFAEGNRKLLKGLLSRDVYDGFAAAISEREARGEKIDQNFVGISKAEILEAGLKKNTAEVTVKFVSELISATLDRAGNVISGDPNSLSEVTDVWTFARETNSRDPNWKLIATQAA